MKPSSDSQLFTPSDKESDVTLTTIMRKLNQSRPKIASLLSPFTLMTSSVSSGPKPLAGSSSIVDQTELVIEPSDFSEGTFIFDLSENQDNTQPDKVQLISQLKSNLEGCKGRHFFIYNDMFSGNDQINHLNDIEEFIVSDYTIINSDLDDEIIEKLNKISIIELYTSPEKTKKAFESFDAKHKKDGKGSIHIILIAIGSAGILLLLTGLIIVAKGNSQDKELEKFDNNFNQNRKQHLRPKTGNKVEVNNLEEDDVKKGLENFSCLLK